jgi:hypothetical protein
MALNTMVYGPYEIETAGAGRDRYYYIVDGRDGRIVRTTVGSTFAYLVNARKAAARLAREAQS